jgi:hypothetical protein
VYAGHAAIALMVKGKRPNIPLWVLVPAAFGPDWISWLCDVLRRGSDAVSHSLPSLAIGACVCALLYFFATRRVADAVIVGLTYLSHWPADFVTGIKPTWPGGPDVGLRLYAYPVADFVIESIVVVVCWLIYRSSLPVLRRRLSVVVPVGLIALQIGFALIQRPEIKEQLRDGLRVDGRRSTVRRLSTIDRTTFRPARSTPHGSCNDRSRTQPERSMADDRGPRGLVTLVCITCGNEKFYDQAVPKSVTCDKCAGTVFRNFATPTEPDDATIASLEEQARSISYGDSSPDTTAGDVRDLDMR